MRFIRENILGDESRRYKDYANQIRSLEPSYNPYTSAGTQGLASILSEYHRGLQTPSFLEDELAKSYQESPYARMEEDHLKRSLANQAAVTGTLGSSYAGKTLAQALHSLIAGDMDKYINRGMGTYQTALSGSSALPGLGLSALGQQNALQQKALQAQLQGNLSSDDATQRLFGYGGRLIGSALSGFLNPSSAASSMGGSYALSPAGSQVPLDSSIASYATVPFFG